MFVDTIALDERDPSNPWKVLGSQLEHIFGEIASDLKLLKELYEPGRIREWDNEFIPANLFKLPPLSIDQMLQHGQDVELHDCLQPDSCLYLIAPIGRGKTTYIHYQLRVALPARIKQWRLVPVIFDVRGCSSPSTFEPLFAEFLDSQIDNAFPFFSLADDKTANTTTHEAHCQAFAEELRKAGQPGTYVSLTTDPARHAAQKQVIADLRRKDPIEFNAKRLAYARRRDPKAFAVLVVDNIDQHLLFPHGEEIIRDSHAFARRLNCPLILTLRDTSFRKNNPAFASASYSPRYLPLSESVAQPMLSHRVKQVQSLVPNDVSLTRFINAVASHLRLSDPDHRDRIARLVDEWLVPIANKNRRELLDLMKSVISSLHLASRTFERNRSSRNDYLNTDFEVAIARLKMAILLGRNPYYADDSYRMSVLNLFRDHRSDTPCRTFVRLKLLQHLALHRKEGVLGSVALDRCTAALGDSAHDVTTIALKMLVEKGLAVAYSDSDEFEASLLRFPIEVSRLLKGRLHITHNGVFHLDVLLKDDIYLDEMKYATPLPSDIYDEVFQDYKGQWPKSRPQRQQSTLRFLEYAVSCEGQDIARRLGRSLSVPQILKVSYEEYFKVVRGMDEHNPSNLPQRRSSSSRPL